MINTREKRVAVIAGLAIAAFALDRAFVSPLLARQSQAQQRIALATQELASAAQLFDNESRARRRASEMAGDTLTSDASAAESQLLNAARVWAQQSGLELNSLKLDRTEMEQGFGRLTARAAASGRTESLARFLYSVQTSRIPVRLADISVTTRREGTDELNVQIGLSTIYLPPQEEQEALPARTGVRR
jgi:hypothetical protein